MSTDNGKQCEGREPA